MPILLPRALRCAAAVLALAPALAVGDDVARLVDGAVVKGHIVERSPNSLCFLVAEKAGSRLVEIATADISFLMEDGMDPDLNLDLDALRAGRTADEPAHVEGDCYVIPLNGAFGKEIEAGPLRAALQRAVDDGVTRIIFDLDSYGGAISTATEVTQALEDYRDRLDYTCVVRRGISASIWLIFACDRIFVTPEATIGGAVAYRVDNSTGSAEVDAKFNSVISAELEATAARNGHTASLVRAMIIPSIELWKWRKRGQPWSIASGAVSAPAGGDAMPLVRKGEVLTLTSQEAVEINLASPIADASPDALGLAVEGRAWTGAGERAKRAYDQAMVECERIRITASRAHQELLGDLERASNHDPRNFPYEFYSGTRQLTPVSQKAWADRSRTALDSFRRAKRHAGEFIAIVERANALRIPDPAGVGATPESLEFLIADLDRTIMRIRNETHVTQLPLDFEAFVPE